MYIMDRYIVRLFIQVLVICFVSLTGMYIVIHAFSNLEEFIDYGQLQGGVLRVLLDFYGARVLTFFDLTSGLLALLAAMFAVAWMQRCNEFTALMAAGISKTRIITPLIAAVAVVSMLAVLNRELWIPRYQDKLSRNAQNWLGERARTLRPRYDNETDIYLSGLHTFDNEKRIEKPHFRLPSRVRGFGRQLKASDAYYLAPTETRPGGYLLKEVKQPEHVADIPSAQIDGRRVVLTAFDTPWLKPDECFVVSAVDYERLAGGDAWRQFSSTAQLIRALHNPSLDYGADVRVTIHGRVVQPILDLILLFLGLPIVLNREGRSFFVASGISLLILAGFSIVTLTCHTLGNNYLLSPALAAWCPLMIFTPIAYGLSLPLWR